MLKIAEVIMMRKFVIGVVVGALLATAGTAAASTIIEKVTASVRTDYSVEVDGQKVALQNAPLAYDGAAYIAVREISNVIGKEVGFQDGVIKIDTPEVTEKMTSEEYENKLYALNNLRNGYLNGIELNKEAIRRADEGQFKPSDEEYQEFVSGLAEYEQLLIEVNQQIAELEARKADLEAE